MRAGVVFQRFSPCSTTANPSLTDYGLKMMFNKKPAWLRAGLTGNRFKIPHSTWCAEKQRIGSFSSLHAVVKMVEPTH